MMDDIAVVYAGILRGDGIDVGKRPHREYGGSVGSGGRMLDPHKVEDMFRLMENGGTFENACRCVGLPVKVCVQILERGRVLVEKYEVWGNEDYLTSQEEDEAMLFAVEVDRLLGRAQFLGELVVYRALRGKEKQSAARLALDVLARRDPVVWDRKNKLAAPPRRNPLEADDPARLGEGKTSRELMKEEEAAIKARNAKVAAMRGEGGN